MLKGKLGELAKSVSKFLTIYNAKSCVQQRYLMNLRITKIDKLLILSTSILFLAVGVVGWLVVGTVALMLLPALSAILTLAVLLELYRRSQEQWRQDYRQIEALFTLFFTLKPTLPIPDMRGWAASPDLLRKIVEIIIQEKPTCVLETGSGVSTLMIAYCLKQIGKGRVFSLEHDAKYATIIQNLVKFHGLEDIARIIHAPLKEVEIDGKSWYWYSLGCFTLDQPIDLLVIDGPPAYIQRLSRYPALPLLYKRLSKKVTIVVDDANREDEQKMLALWENQFPCIKSEFLNIEKGAFVCKICKADLPESP